MCLCSQPSLTERTVDDHRQLPARYGAMGSALRGRLAAVLLHHVGGHDHPTPGQMTQSHRPARLATRAASSRYGGRHHPGIPGGIKSVCLGGIAGIRILNAPALAILNAFPSLGRRVIGGVAPEKPRSDLKRPWTAVTREVGLDGLRIHELWHFFASIGAGVGMGLRILGKHLGHANASTTARYAHLDADPLQRASNAIGATIASAIDGQPSGTVLPLKLGA